MKLTFPYPPKELLPNRKASWQQLMAVTGGTREDCYYHALEQKEHIKAQFPLKQVELEITWYPPDKRRIADFDSIFRATKPILDSLVDAKIIKDDSPKIIRGVKLSYGKVDKDNPRTEIDIVRRKER